MDESLKQQSTTDDSMATMALESHNQRDFTDSEIAILNNYILDSCGILLKVDRNFMNQELHKEANQQMVRTFAQDKSQENRALVVAKQDPNQTGQGSEAPAADQEGAQKALPAPGDQPKEAQEVTIIFTSKVEFLGQSAHTIAFLKRENYARLDLEDHKLAIEENGSTADAGPAQNSGTDLSAQLQVVNLGFLGPDANIFEFASTYFDFYFLPLFSDYKKKQTAGAGAGAATADAAPTGASGLDGVLKELSSLKLQLAQCRQNLEIPMIDLVIDPDVKARVEKAKKAGTVCKVNDFEDLMKEDSFKKRLENNIANWKKEIRKVTSLDHQIMGGTALQEMNFWAQMERSLFYLQQQLLSSEVTMVQDILRQTGRMILVVQFTTDIDVESKMKQAIDYNQKLKEIPLKSLLDAMTFTKVQDAIKKILSQLKKARQLGSYPLQRTLDLSELIAFDFDEQIKKILDQHDIMRMDFNDFKAIQKELSVVQSCWEASIKDFRSGIVHTLTGSLTTNGHKIQEQIARIEDDPLFRRFNSIAAFRSEHFKLEQVIENTFGRESNSTMTNVQRLAQMMVPGAAGARTGVHDQALTAMQTSYEIFVQGISALDYTKEGQAKWDAAKKVYDTATAKIEAQLTEKLKQKLEVSKSANESFHVFSVYSKLLQRPKVRAAIAQFQVTLVSQVHKDIEKLKEKLFNEGKMDDRLNETRDFPKIVNQIVWINQLDQKLQFYQNRIKEVLGEDWQSLAEGSDLKRTCELLQRRLQNNQNELIRGWQQKLTECDFQKEKDKMIFRIQQVGQKFNLVLNLGDLIMRIFKEKQNLEKAAQHFNLPFRITMQQRFKAEQQDNIYSIATSIKQSLRTFQVSNARVNDSFAMLIANKKNDAQFFLLAGLERNWKNEGATKDYAQKLLPKVIEFENAVNEVMSSTAFVEHQLDAMKQCKVAEISNKLEQIQKIISDFDLHDLSNLQKWVEDLNEKIEQILVRRLEEVVQKWIEEFKNFEEMGGELIPEPLELKVKLQNRTLIYLDPPLSEARAFWYKKIHDQVEVICGLERVDFKRDPVCPDEKTYKSLLLQMDEKRYCMRQAYEEFEAIFNQVEINYDTWKSYQALWDIDLKNVYTMLGDNIDKWNQLLNEIRHNRKTFDTGEDYKQFGAIELNYATVQSKVYDKYDTIHKEILNRFGSTLGGQMRDFMKQVQEARHKLEQLNTADSDDVTVFVTEVKEKKEMLEKWELQLDRLKLGNKLLVTQRYVFPGDFVQMSRLEGEWNAFKEIFGKKQAQMVEQLPSLQAKVMQESDSVQKKIAEIKNEWENQRPQNASELPYLATSQIKTAIEKLVLLETRLKSTVADLARVCKAQQQLDLEVSDQDELENTQEDHRNLLQVWQAIREVWNVIDQKIDQQPFQVYVYKTIKDILEAQTQTMREFPNRMRSYQIYEAYLNQLKNYKKANDIMSDIRSDQMKPKHLKDIANKLQINPKINEWLVVTLWQADLLAKRKLVEDIVTQARGEAILENFLNNIKEVWQHQEVELVKYQNKCKLIKGWDDLFQIVDDHLANISSMKMSPYYKVFEKDIEPWTRTLNEIRVVFDVWIDVQRRYVYLEGIFFGSADIKSMLSNEFTKFKGIDNDFTRLMKRVTKSPNVLSILEIENLQRSLDTFTSQLQLIQKALGEYLEKQRQEFARFYFVGDEDLLEIIGNSKEIVNIQRHFPKMFAGITTVQSEKDANDCDVVLGMNSREGESVPMNVKVVIGPDSVIYKWLTEIEKSMQTSLAHELDKALQALEPMDRVEQPDEFNSWIVKFAAQIVILSMQVSWSHGVEDRLASKAQNALKPLEQQTQQTLEMLADKVLSDLPSEIRKKYEQLITDLVHQKEVTSDLIAKGVTNREQFEWKYQMRFYWRASEKVTLNKLGIQMANGEFQYGFEYLGVAEKLVQTPLTDKCYLTLTQALHWRMGGSPFGPAGTGKTESVKALGAQLGKFVLVFNCDETFDGNAMGRIFVGLCQVGAWGCFDEFNRLEERMLSAVSQQILTIQVGLREQTNRIDLMGRDVKLNMQMGIFITMNPDYAGRSQLPDNLKQLFRQMAMTQPDKEMIARVMLYSQGFTTAQKLSGKIVSLFDLCKMQLSEQSHYDFGLRALKSVLVSSGNLKRSEKAKMRPGEVIDEKWEQNILIKSLCDTLVPKLIADDIPLLSSLLSGVFPGSSIVQQREGDLINNLHKYATKYNLQAQPNFIEKCMQLYQIQCLCHGVMMVGPTGCGKSAAWNLLLYALEKTDGCKTKAYKVDPKAITKDDLYGKLDSTTAEWTDGVFTGILRNIIENNDRGKGQVRHWIIFDGDVDPEWAENLNSVLDDNKLLTLPSGERLTIPPNVRIMFEVETLKHATLATVSRCGMVWFSEETITTPMIYNHYLARLQQDDFDKATQDIEEPAHKEGEEQEQKPAIQQLSEEVVKSRAIRKQCVNAIRPMFVNDDDTTFATKALDLAQKQIHVMMFTRIRCLEAMFTLIRQGIENILEYNENTDFPLEQNQIEQFMTKYTVFASIWGIGGSMNLETRTNFSNEIANFTDVETPMISGGANMIDYEIRLDDQRWHLWSEQVPTIDLDASAATNADQVITTVDTTRHQEVLCSWLQEKRPFLLCGPPGSGKTMTLMATLKKVTDMEMIFINFSSSTTPALILKTFDHYCEVKKTNQGLVMSPLQADKWLVVFCDEINLPEADKYGTQTVITFLRQITEHKGFHRQSDKQWVHLNKIMFVGACNPPTDSGRVVLTDRFLRWAPLIFVDFPGPESLKQIYGTFNRALLKQVPSLRNLGDPLTDAMVEFYGASQKHFTADMQPHYIYSPRELTRWKVAIIEGLESLNEPEDLVRLYVHEGLRLFEDRLVYQHEKDWCNKTIDEVAQRCFGSQVRGIDKALERPIYFTTQLHRMYKSVGADELKVYIEARLKQFQEEELDVPLVVFDTVLDHITRIDRVLRQPIGHLLLCGNSGVGKTTLTRFVASINNLEVFQIKAGRNYSVYDFDEDLRKVMRASGIEKKKICFIFDESNVLSAAFLERMNALLAAGEVPGLFDGEDYTKLIQACKEEARKANKMIDTEEELYKQFTKEVQRNLHIVFTMNPATPDFSNRSASSPALFNRCVIDWFGDWTDDGLLQVCLEFTKYLDFQSQSFTKNMDDAASIMNDDPSAKRLDPKHELICQTMVEMHKCVRDKNNSLMKAAKRFNFMTPRDFLNFIKQFIALFKEKGDELEEQQSHLQIGVNKLEETESSVESLREQLKEFDIQLTAQKKLVKQKLEELTEKSQQVKESQKAAEAQQAELEVSQKAIAERSQHVNGELAKAEPALIAAQSAVSGVSAKDIDTLKNFTNPPAKVKVAMEPVIALVLNKPVAPEWKDVRAELRKADFKKNILEYNKDKISPKVKAYIKEHYLADESKFNIQDFYKASSAAGPLASWAKSIIEYADIFQNIEPMRIELDGLQQEADKKAKELAIVTEALVELKNQKEQMSNDYQDLITEQNACAKKQEEVSNKVERANSLYKNLSSELVRWKKSSQNFQEAKANLMGDVLLSSGVLTYIGFFDHYQRQNIQGDWKISIEQISLKYSLTMNFTEFLSKPQERLTWQSEALPNDELCLQNAIIMKKYIRYPLVIDPADQAKKYVLNHFKAQKIQETSFGDNDFLARISEGLQYGVPVLVQDVEKIDPVMNSVLNKEVQKVGGRRVMQVGDKEIACNGELTLFMFTRNANAVFTPDLCSRVTFVNFTVTPSSLMSQCLNEFLKSERPDIEKERTNLLKVQGEYKEQLRDSEDKLLDALAKSEGEILENDALIKTLETIKRDAKTIEEAMGKTEETLEKIEEVSNLYKPLSTMTTRIFFTLESMGTIDRLYQFQLKQFMDLVFRVLKEDEVLNKIPKDAYDQRLKCITQQLFVTVNQTIGQGLKQEHYLLFTMRLAQIKLSEDPVSEELFDLFIRSSTSHEPALMSVDLFDQRLSKSQVAQIEEIAESVHFKNLKEDVVSNEQNWINYLDDQGQTHMMPEPWRVDDDSSATSEVARQLKKMIISKILRPDRLLETSRLFLKALLGENIVNINPVELMDFAGPAISPYNPIMLVSAPGYDASYKVELLAKQKGTKYISVAIGSPEAFGQAEKSINQASKNGTWVLLKNVHLAPQWLMELEKKIYNLVRPDPKFRLFMTMENNPKVPLTLLMASHVLVFEQPSGVKAAMVRSFTSTITPEKCDSAPLERKRLHFIVAWFNAVIQERLRFRPIGWSKLYEFNEADQRCTLVCVDEWLDTMGKGRANVDPDKIPWDALRSIISTSIFGGKIDNLFDHKILQSLVEKFFCAETYNADFKLFMAPEGSNEQVLSIPDDAKSHKDFLQWIRAIDLPETPAWSGLPNNVEKIVRQRDAAKLVMNIKLIQGTGDDLAGGDDAQEDKADWLSSVHKQLLKYQEILPGQLELLHRTAQAISNPLFRFLEREVTVASQLLDLLRDDMQALIEMCIGERKSTNILKSLAEDLYSDQIPKRWRKYVVANIPVTAWINDFIKRVEQLQRLSKAKDFGQSGLWFGGLLFPEAYLTATRQAVAQANNWSLEELEMQFEMNLTQDQIEQNTQGFILTDFSMEGAEYAYDQQRVKLSEQISSRMPNVNFKWVNKNAKKVEDDAVGSGATDGIINLPVYLNSQRTNLITQVKIPSFGIPPYVWYQRGVALFAWSTHN